MQRSDALKLARVRQSTKDGTARAIREAAGLSQAEVGDVCGVSAAAVGRWECGARAPRGDPALRYARLLDALAEGQVPA